MAFLKYSVRRFNRSAYGEIERMLVGELVWEISQELRLLKFEVCSDLARRQLELKTERKSSFIGMGGVLCDGAFGFVQSPVCCQGGIINRLFPVAHQEFQGEDNLIDLYEAWNKSEEADKWRAKLAQTEAVRE